MSGRTDATDAQARDFETIAALASNGDPIEITIQGARTHNLQDIDLRIPRDRFVVITGPSGSGKSSLAFDTIYAEGQRRYVESLSAYARQFLDQLARPDVESIDGLSPAVAIEQKGVGRSPRSTVGTITEIADYLRLLYARAGTAYCWTCDTPISSQALEEMVDRIFTLPNGTKIQILAPIVRGRKGQYKKELERFRRDGFVRARIDGKIVDLSEDIEIARNVRHDIEIVVDRLVVKESARARLTESLGAALRLADDLALIDIVDRSGSEAWWLSRTGACPTCDNSFPEISPRLFSFNNPFGACKACHGLGVESVFDAARIIPDESRSIQEGAIAPWDLEDNHDYYHRLLENLATRYSFSLDTPWKKLPKALRSKLISGDPSFELEIEVPVAGRGRRRPTRSEVIRRPFDGVIGDLTRRLEIGGGRGRSALARFRREQTCPECQGARLRIEARHVRVGDCSLPELTQRSISEVIAFFAELKLPSNLARIAERIEMELRERLGFLEQVGLGYLSLDRPAATLSGGEAQRIRLATQIGARLIGVLYILDEPSIGLHSRDNDRLLQSLESLRDLGNSLIVVEHDEATIRRADYVIDIGPGAGIHGGLIVAEGSPDEIISASHSTTGDFISGRRRIETPKRRPTNMKNVLRLRGCRTNNLKNVDLEIPLGCLTVVSGVSGSGKSTLINDTLHPILAAELHGSLVEPGEHLSMSGLDQIDKVVDVDQSPIGRSPRSNPATYSGAFTGIRSLFAQVPEARVRGWDSGRFSFNVKGGRCEACEGDGAIRMEMQFLPDAFVGCEVCTGRRYDRETLSIRHRGKSIADVLEMTVVEALALFENIPTIARPLQALSDVGLDYLRLGQSATTLSGGEAQRMKLAKELARKATGRTLYLLDEPTTGLHFVDVEQLLGLVDRLVDRGNTVVIIEHNLDVIRYADHIVDLGPEGGDAGGKIVVVGTPEEVSQCAESHTGVALALAMESQQLLPKQRATVRQIGLDS
ncbi:MAG TPA: excinuclease ABC subunit UvrA [Myxococcales bacterium]|nr:excinuclease ABC subunit UvrA [Myxococcales bacterium]HIK85083.1 excinuclease ABC subunit UvrA [Myxococcales bacterium]